MAELAEGDVLNEAGQAELGYLQAVLDGAFTDALKAIAVCVDQTGIATKCHAGQPDLLLDLLAFQLSGMTGFRDMLDISLGTPCNAPSTETGFDADKRWSKPSACPKDRWGVDLKKAFASFKKKGTKHRDAELTRQLAKLLTGGDDAFSAVLADKSHVGIRRSGRQRPRTSSSGIPSR